jgi:hypothetical protein
MTTKVRGSTLLITDDNSTNETRYLTQVSGVSSNVYISTSALTFNPSTGTVSSTLFSASSDERLKKNINTITDPLGKVLQLRGVTFTWNQSGRDSIGVIAQEVEKIIPEIVTETNGVKQVAYDALVPLLIEAIKEQQKQIDELKKINKQ